MEVPPLPVTLRPADANDASGLAVLGAATFFETYAGALPGPPLLDHCSRVHTLAAWRDMLSAADVRCWIAQAPGGAPIGYALVTAPDIPGQAPDDAELRRIYVLSRWHGHGVGAALMRAALDQADADGHRRILLGVHAQNEQAIAFYLRSGFQLLATRVFMVGELACDDQVLARNLQPRGSR